MFGKPRSAAAGRGLTEATGDATTTATIGRGGRGCTLVAAAMLLAAWSGAGADADGIPTPVAEAFMIDVTDEATVTRGYALDVESSEGVYRIGVVAKCERATQAVVVWLYFGPFPTSTPVQAAVRTADGRIERFGGVVAMEHGPQSGFHSPYLTEAGDVRRFLEAAFTTGALVSNGHMSWWHQISSDANDEARRTLMACGGLQAP